jgi:hypothetical protein
MLRKRPVVYKQNIKKELKINKKQNIYILHEFKKN